MKIQLLHGFIEDGLYICNNTKDIHYLFPSPHQVFEDMNKTLPDNNVEYIRYQLTAKL